MKIPSKKIINFIIIALIILNVGGFFVANTFPINWTQQEMFWHGFFWSMDDVNDFHLHSGIKAKDWLKPFVAFFVDGHFRTRQVSYLFDMLSFKFWQSSGDALFRNYSLIGLHILNTFLLWILLYIITKHIWTSWLGALIFLNSSITLATLLFPFRSAKLLVISFFLFAWIIAAYDDKKKFFELNILKQTSFFLLLFLALLTDEIALFIFPLVFVTIALRDGIKSLFHKKIISGLLLTSGLFLLFIFGAYKIGLSLGDEGVYGAHSEFLVKMSRYFSSWSTLYDTLNAFFNYFIKRFFGFWNNDYLGISSLIASCFLFLFIIFNKKKALELKIAIAICITFVLKAFLLPHNGYIHTTIMPEDATFPSLLFFSYYYVYCEALLVSMIIALLLKAAASNKKKLLFLLLCISVINSSNIFHLRKGPHDALAFSNWHNSYRQQIALNVKNIDRLLSQENLLPVYLSFPSGNKEFAEGRRHDPIPSIYCHYVLTRYLRTIELGKAIISLKNISPEQKPQSPHELSNSSFFYDVSANTTYDLTLLKKESSFDLTPQKISMKIFRTKAVPITSNADQLLFFVKGKASFSLQIGKKEVPGMQVYGQSYQIFQIDLTKDLFKRAHQARIQIIPEGANDVYLVGPFVLNNQ